MLGIMWLLSNKILVKESGLFEEFRDFHSHLLSGVDDGVEEQVEAFCIIMYENEHCR